MSWPFRRRIAGLVLAIGLSVLATTVTAAHPLGNFTINHYAGLRIEPDRVRLDIVIDQAEIPTFQARQDLDTDDDGEVSDGEVAAAREPSCRDLAATLTLIVGEVSVEPDLTMAGLTFPPGAGGLSTMRLVCAFEAAYPAPIQPDTQITFADGSFADRIGWREIVVEASGVSLAPIDGELRTESVSSRLTEYPADLLDEALVDEALVVSASPGGPLRPVSPIVDAQPVAAVGPAGGDSPRTTPEPRPAGGAVPGGVTGDIPSIFGAADLTPLILLASLLTAAALGAGHALTPGHGKTLMAAYLVGSRGTPVHAIWLGMSVSVSHTLGILVLAFVVVGAQGVLSPDLVVRVAPLVAALTIVAIGGWMLVSELRRRTRRRSSLAAPAAAHVPDSDHGHDLAHGDDAHAHGNDPHVHGGIRHSHVPAPGSTITWRSLFVLGLAGGIIPSTNALLILLGTIAAGRAAFGVVLVVAFGLGMAVVMAGVGLAMIVARGRLVRFGSRSRLGRIGAWMPLGAGLFVLGVGLYLTVQSITGPTVL